MSVSIANSMVPSQEHTRQGQPAPRQFAQNDWAWSLNRQWQNDWNGLDSQFGNPNWFAKNEPYQAVKNGMFNPLTGREPIAGHVNFVLNPLDQEQTNSHTSAYALMKQTRVANNMDPFRLMVNSAPGYGINQPPNKWVNRYTGSSIDRPAYPARF